MVSLYFVVIVVSAAVYLVVNKPTRTFGFIACVAALAHVAHYIGWPSLVAHSDGTRGRWFWVTMAVLLIVGGVGAWMRSRRRIAITSATALAFIGSYRLITFI